MKHINRIDLIDQNEDKFKLYNHFDKKEYYQSDFLNKNIIYNDKIKAPERGKLEIETRKYSIYGFKKEKEEYFKIILIKLLKIKNNKRMSLVSNVSNKNDFLYEFSFKKLINLNEFEYINKTIKNDGYPKKDKEEEDNLNFSFNKLNDPNFINLNNNIKQSIFIEELKDKIIKLNKIIDESTLYYYKNNENYGGQNVVFNEDFGYKIENNQLIYDNKFISEMLNSSEYIVLFYNENDKYYLLLIEKIIKERSEIKGFKTNIILKKAIDKNFFEKYINNNEYISINKNDFQKIEHKEFNLSENFKKIEHEIKNKLKDINEIVTKRINKLENNEHYDEMLDNLLNELEKNNQLIIYGTAGLGKSHSIQELIDKKENSKNYPTFRTVFHPEFSYYDFIGKILPIKNGNSISYNFEPGIFTKAYNEAKNDLNKNVYLVIDEINRGYTTGIFGDIFLLLDRKNNVSEYNIEWTGLQGEAIKKDDYKLKLPENLYIIGTMNTSDKTTIKLDKAFERRFNKYFISLSESIDNYSNHTYLEENYGTTWKDFLTNLNKKIKNDLSSSVEDIDNELIGPFFIKSTKYLNFDNNSIANLFPDLVNGKYQNGSIDSFNGVEFETNEYEALQEMIKNHSIIAKSDIQYSLMYHLWYSTYADNRKQLTNSISFEDFITIDYNDFIESIINYKKESK